MSNFIFLKAGWLFVYEAAIKASNAVYPDPRTALFLRSPGTGTGVQRIYKYDVRRCTKIL